MKHHISLVLTGLIVTGTAHAAFIVEASDSGSALGAGNFAYTGVGGGVASFSDASTGNLPAFGEGTFFTLRHAWGGSSTVGDQYTFSYTPDTDGDNQAFAVGTTYNLRGTLPDLTSSGLSGGTAGIYNVYRIHPANPGTSAGNSTIYDVLINGVLQVPLTQTVDQNPSSATGENVGRWELIGSVSVPNATDTVAVTMTPTPTPTGYVSMRASGIMFEYVSPIPEPGSMVLLGLGAVTLLGRRRR